MELPTVEGTLIRADSTHLVMQEEDGTIATYSREYFRLPMDYGSAGKPRLVAMTDKLHVDLDYSINGAILVPLC
ncbi:MAG: hypothetical protein J7559_16855 [Cohnella sp.]|nr:hypothetical protein [Cohnella sp.]